MRRLVVLISCMSLFACTAIKPLEVDAETLRSQIRSGTAIRLDDRIRTVTERGQSNSFRVTAITSDHFVGKDVAVPIDDIVLVEKRKLDGTKTTMAVVGIAAGAYLTVMLTAGLVLLAAL